MTENELRDAFGMNKHEMRQYEGGVGCSCGKEWRHVEREALWRSRTHELNFDGSPCWCPTDTEPDIHSAECLANREVLRNRQ